MMMVAKTNMLAAYIHNGSGDSARIHFDGAAGSTPQQTLTWG